MIPIPVQLSLYVCCCEQRDLMNKKRQRNPHTLVLPNEDKTSGRLSPRGDAKPLMRPAPNVTQVVSPYCQSTCYVLAKFMFRLVGGVA